jgi:hypothetical protein
MALPQCPALLVSSSGLTGLAAWFEYALQRIVILKNQRFLVIH